MVSLASWLYGFTAYVAIIGKIICMLFSITFRLIRMNALSTSNNKVTLLSSLLYIELRVPTAASYPTCWPTQTCKWIAYSRMFVLVVVITMVPRVVFVTSPIHIGLSPGFLSREISVHAKKTSSDPTFPKYLFRHNCFAMSANAPQISRPLSQNYDKVRMRRKPFVIMFNGPAAPLISGACLCIRAKFVSSNAYSSHNSSGPWNKSWSHFQASSGCFLRRSMVCLLVGGIPALWLSEISLKVTFIFQLTWSFWIF